MRIVGAGHRKYSAADHGETPVIRQAGKLPAFKSFGVWECLGGRSANLERAAVAVVGFTTDWVTVLVHRVAGQVKDVRTHPEGVFARHRLWRDEGQCERSVVTGIYRVAVQRYG